MTSLIDVILFGGKMKELKNIDEINKVIQKDFVILIAKTKGCGVCTPVSQRLASIVNEYDNVPLYQIYIDEVFEFRGQHLVFSVPTVMIFSFNKEILRESRFINFENIKRIINNYNK